MHTKTAPLTAAADGLRYPFETPPKADEAIEVAPGLIWVRLTLPSRFNVIASPYIESPSA